ncbi:MAG TPA: hypothetical protein VKV39_05985 [Candidatus Sulfotelmatobacter sp.]|nr:hypothetical protein [Candidatus Sulfotelmatobacter sp.]
MRTEDIARSFQGKTNEELLRIALHIGQLSPETTSILRAELARRRLDDPERVNSTRLEDARRRAEEANDPGTLFFFSRLGFGRIRFGKAEYTYDAETHLEKFKTTLFWVLFWFPLIPSGTCRVERRRKFFSRKIRSWEKLPLDWKQVLRVWMAATAIIFGLMLLVTLVRRVA